uniref:Threonine/serine exporter-like N-terminal domain-containing protein n=1 Tax=Psilocybe cubensis TaxID=181762 RepID=A0A8H8CL20_PSICU
MPSSPMTSAEADNSESSHNEPRRLDRPLAPRRVSLVPLGAGGGSTSTINGRTARPRSQAEGDDIYRKYSLSSYQHPYDISPPTNVHTGSSEPSEPPSFDLFSFHNRPSARPSDDTVSPETPWPHSGPKSNTQGMLSSMMNFYTMAKSSRAHDDNAMRSTFSDSDYEDRPGLRRDDSEYSQCSIGSDILEPDDPRVTGKKLSQIHDQGDLEKNTLRQMDYKTRRKHIQRIRIEFNVSSMKNRHEFLLKLARALMTFGAPSHRIESQLIAAARILEVEAEFIHLPGIIISSFGDQDLGCSETHFVKCGGRLSLGALHKVHLIYRSVVHDEISAKQATEQLEALLSAPPPYSKVFRCFLAFCLAALICPLAFGGSFVDMWIAGLAAFFLSYLQLQVAQKSALYANVFEITISIIVSFIARGLSSIRSQIFCYTAISSSGIIGILPGYLILSSSLELASKNIVCGSVKMVYALIYTLFLGFGLQIGNDFYLLFDPTARRHLDELAANLSSTVVLTGSWLSDNITDGSAIPLNGTWTFSHTVMPQEQDIYEGCYRPKRFPWYLQPFPFWTSFLIVPLFSTISSLANLQPLWSKQLPVMVIISCCSYASNKIANHYIFNRSDVVSAIGAFTVGLLGNIYSRRMGGTAFTSMVTGVLFLVPSGLSQAGGITANGNGIDIGGAMIAVTIGITVGLFMSQALVYTFGSRKNAAVFSF